MSVRLYKPADDDAIFELLKDVALIGSSIEERDLLARCNKLVDALFVYEDNGNPSATISLVRRAPNELWAVHNVNSRKKSQNHRSLAIWRTAIQFAKINNIDWFSGMFRPGDVRLHRYYHKLVWIEKTQQEAYNPLPLCYRIWDDLNDHHKLFPQYDCSKELTLYNKKSTIKIDFDKRDVYAFSNDTCELLIKEKLKLELCHRDPQTFEYHSNQIHHVPCTGALHIKNAEFVILSPWWASLSTEGLQLPVLDKWPWSDFLQTTDHILFKQIDTKGNIHHLTSILNTVNSYTLVYRGSPQTPFIRLTLQSKYEPRIENNKISFVHSSVFIETTLLDHNIFQWNREWRITLHAKTKEMVLHINLNT